MNERGDPMDRKRRVADSVSKNGGAGKRSVAKAPERDAKTPVRGSTIKKPLARDSKQKTAPRRARIEAPAIRYEPGRLIDSEAALAEAAEGLRALDADFIRRLVEVGGPPPLRLRAPGFAGMAAIIVSQQVSVASATAIFGRLEARLAPLDAAAVLAAGDDTLRACGLSGPKIRALRAIARAVAEGLDLGALGSIDAVDAHRALVAVSGIGPWTADVFLLFCLGHPDAFPAGDVALQEAARLALGLKTRPDARGLEAIAERWRPWRGVAARMLWAYYRQAKQRSGMALASASA
jgi:DNA-3-methyladenine glycosylase II